MENIKINPNIVDLKESATLRVNEMARTIRSQGGKVYHFGFGQSPFPVHSKIVKELQVHAAEKDYLPTLGLLPLRQAISKSYKEKFNYDFSTDRILIGPGSKELIFQALFVLEGPVIIPAPSWVSYGPQVNIRGKPIVRALTKRENNYKLQAQELRQVCATLPDKEQKVLILNSPNNPTGQVYSDEEIQKLVEVCREESIVVISDEIYALIDFTGIRKKGFSHYYPEGTLVTAGLSKSHSAGGYRLGFLAAPENLKPVIKALSALVSETFSAVSAPVQYAAVKAYSKDKDIDCYLDRCNKIHAQVGGYIAKRLTAMGLDCPSPEGAFYVYPDFIAFREKLYKRFSIKNSEELSKVLLEVAHVALLPGSDFYMPDTSLTARMATVDYEGAELLKAVQRGESLAEEFVIEHCSRLVEGLDTLESFLKAL